jgi:hypothetical protein
MMRDAEIEDLTVQTVRIVRNGTAGNHSEVKTMKVGHDQYVSEAYQQIHS